MENDDLSYHLRILEKMKRRVKAAPETLRKYRSFIICVILFIIIFIIVCVVIYKIRWSRTKRSGA
jgi:large-conductance mechanosensitive channel